MSALEFPLLYTQDLSYTYSASGFKIENVNLNIPGGQTTGVIGKNGSGKSTILKLIAGHLPKSSGGIYFQGVDISLQPSRLRPVATVFQTLALFPHLSVEENLAFPMIYGPSKASKSERLKQVDELLQLFDISAFAKRPATALSLGQQQKVAIARALASKAKVLFLDEPTASLDFSTKDQLIEILNTIKAEKLVEAIVLITHDRDFLLATCQQIALIENGCLYHQGTLAELRTKPPSLAVAEALGIN